MTYRDPLSIGEVASILRVSNKSVLNWISKGALKTFTTYGGHHRIWPADVKAFVDQSGMDISFEFIDERSPLRLLIIDDDRDYVRLMTQVLRVELPNVEVTSTGDGYEGLILIGEIQPQLLILDLKMPKLNGFEVLRRLATRAIEHQMKILVLSAYLDKNTRDRLAQTIANATLEKTSDFRVLIGLVADLLQGAERGERSMVHKNDFSAPRLPVLKLALA